MKIVIAGAGNVGGYLVGRLSAEDHSVVVIDQREKVLDNLSSHYDIQTVCGSSSDIEVLREAGVPDADIIVAATDSDEVNLISCLLGSTLNADIRRIARVRQLSSEDGKLPEPIHSVTDQIINPDVEAAEFLLHLFEVPGASEVIDFADGRIRVVGILMRPDSAVVGKPLKELRLHEHDFQMLVIAIARDGQLLIPGGDDTLQAGDTVYIASEPDRIADIFRIIGVQRPPVRTVMISGGSGVGVCLAKELAKLDLKVKLIENDADRCEKLASELSGVLVLNGEGTDQYLLREEGIEDVDVFVGASYDEEENILAALLAKRLGATVGAVVLSKTSYLSLVPTIGVDIVVSPRIAAASSILKYVRSGGVTSVFSIRDDTAELLETVLESESAFDGKELREIRLPSGAIVVAVFNDESVTIPTGRTKLHAGDHLVFLVNREVLPKVEKMLQKKGFLF